MRRLLVPALVLLTGCAGAASTGVAEPGVPGRAVQAHDARTGELLWRKEVAPPTAATEPVLAGSVVLVPGEPLVAYDAAGGERLWSLDEPVLLPQAVGEVVVVAREREVQAVDARSGRSLWRRPVTAGGRVAAGPGGVAVLGEQQVRLLSLEGDEQWAAQVGLVPLQAHPAQDVVVVAGLRGDVLGLSAADGRELWRAATPPAEVVHVAGDRVLLRAGAAVLALDAADGTELWRQEAPSSGAPLQVAGDRVLVVQHGERSRVLSLVDGRVLAEPRAGDVELLADGLVEADADELRFDGPERGWRATVSTGDRPALWADADDRVAVAVVGWGQPASRD